MLTEECGLNPFLEARGYEVTDTDLGERIIQFMEIPPSHIVLPAIHIKKSEISELFHERLGTEAGNVDPNYLADAARLDLRKHMLAAEVGITGVNFAVAETGGVVVCTNEGNADLGTALPRIHIACMGIEKLVPRFEDLGVFIRLLARSATGQASTAYTSHFTRPAPGRELHIVLVDNGRSALRQKKAYRRSLGCIRCGACLNTCPVYRRSGGYSYNYTLPGPIGSVLAPHRDLGAAASLPYASSLCGSCTDVCPVKIDLHDQLLHLRGDVVAAGHAPLDKRLMIHVAALVFKSAQRFQFAGKLLRLALHLPKFLINNPLNVWGRHRDLPTPPATSFREWYERRHGK
jgi:L-lactate dehydrogenase complex protein LldF